MRFLSVVLIVMAIAAPARADMEAAKLHHKKGMSYFALGKFAEAATEYEAAFELEPDAAFLYNAAQAHRAAGNRVRALALYQSFARLFPDHPDAPNVRRQAAMLKTTVDAEKNKEATTTRAVATTTTMPPAVSKEPAARPTLAPPAAPTATPVVTAVSTTPLTAPTPPPAKKKTPRWVWGVVAGVAVAAVGVGVGLGVGLGGGDRYPTATAGSARIP